MNGGKIVNPLPTGQLCMFLSSGIFFSNSTFSKASFKNAIRVSNILDPGQVRRFVGPDLDPNCFQRLSADDTSRKRVKNIYCYYLGHFQ